MLALERTRLANERTLLAYARTTIMLVVSGVTLIKLFPEDPTFQRLGWSMLPIAFVSMGIGVYRFVRLQRRLTVEA